MSKAQNLIKLANEATYAIGAGGLKAIGGESILIQPKTIYFMGASSSPKMIIVTKVDDKWIHYTEYPYREIRRDQKKIFTHLIQQGTQTWLKSGYPKYHPKLAKTLQSLLAGKKVKTNVDYRDHQYIMVRVKNLTDKDLWRDAEAYGSVGGFQLDGKEAYAIRMERHVLAKIKKDKRFEVIDVKEDD